jgi:hypothetical protein
METREVIMQSVKPKIQKVVTQLADEVRALFKVKGEAGQIVKARPAATPKQIAAYEAYLQLSLPPMYRAFVELHNGYDWLVIFGHMQSMEDVMPGGVLYDRVIDWKKTSAEDGAGEVLSGVVIGRKSAANPNFIIYLNPDKEGPDGEWAVVDDMVDATKEYPNLAVFFEKQVEACKRLRKKAAGG